MTDPLFLAVARTALSSATKLVGFAYEWFRRPTVSYKRAPKNLFTHIKPGTSVARVKELLGPPHQETDGQYRYAFSEACVQVDSTDKTTVDSVSVGLRGITRRNRFHVWPINNLLLGKTTFASIIDASDKVIFDYSSKFYHFYVFKYYGFSGHYWNYALGYLECPGVSPDGYHWSPDTQSRHEIPRKLIFNWACVTRLEEPPLFNHYGFL